jgi:hypothetical protein
MKITFAAVFAAAGLLLASAQTQQAEKPQIVGIGVTPTDGVSPGPCKASTAGYLEIGGRTELTEAEIGGYVKTALHDGYTVTIYPPAKRGIFVNAACGQSGKR